MTSNPTKSCECDEKRNENTLTKQPQFKSRLKKKINESYLKIFLE